MESCPLPGMSRGVGGSMTERGKAAASPNGRAAAAPSSVSVERQAAGMAGYRPALDDIRAVAVLAVIGYHLGYGRAQGGFLGVDIFFVLSG